MEKDYNVKSEKIINGLIIFERILKALPATFDAISKFIDDVRTKKNQTSTKIIYDYSSSENGSFENSKKYCFNVLLNNDSSVLVQNISANNMEEAMDFVKTKLGNNNIKYISYINFVETNKVNQNEKVENAVDEVLSDEEM